MLGAGISEIGLGLPAVQYLILVASPIAFDVRLKFGGIGMPEIVVQVLPVLVEVGDLLVNHRRDEQGHKKHHHSQTQLPTGRELAEEEKREGAKCVDEENVTGPDQDEVSESDDGQPAIPDEIRP